MFQYVAFVRGIDSLWARKLGAFSPSLVCIPRGLSTQQGVASQSQMQEGERLRI